MEKIALLSGFCIAFIWLVSKDRVYVVPFILLIFSNINGILSWEDFAAVGLIKFPDYGLVISFLILLFFLYEKGLSQFNCKSILMKWVYVYFAYLIFLFFYSFLIQGGLEWPIKMGRRFYYGIVLFVVVAVAYRDPLAKFEKVFEVLLLLNVGFALLYIGYNYFGLDVYAEEAYEEFATDDDFGVARRNFAGYPFMASYFAIHCWMQFLLHKEKRILNILFFLAFLACAVAMLTRGLVLALAFVIALAPFLRAKASEIWLRLTLLAVVTVPLIFVVLQSDNAYLAVLLDRFSEIVQGGLGGASNAQVRQNEFAGILSAVSSFNPLFGFGFTNIELMGFQAFSQMHAGSADNAYSNLIGTQGLFGILFYLIIFALWLIVNRKLRKLGAEDRSLTHFLFILFVLLINMNGALYSYFYALALPLCYDAMVYAQLSLAIKRRRLNAIVGRRGI